MDHMHNHPHHGPIPPEHHHHHHHCVPECDDQLPIISRVGRGLQGDDITAQLVTDADGHIHLEIYQHDHSTNETIKIHDAIVDGGRLKYYYNLSPYNDPATFTITFAYDNANPDLEWEWTTPAIPYLWTAKGEGEILPDDVVGTGVGTIFIRKTTEEWEDPVATPHNEEEANACQEKLIYPTGWSRDELNAPDPIDPWTVNLSYGVGGDIDAPNIDDLAKILGITVEQIRNIIADMTDQITDPDHNISEDNFKDYIDAINDHIHDDMGFDEHLIGDDNDVIRNTIKKYIDGLRFDIYKNLGMTDPSNDFYSESPDQDDQTPDSNKLLPYTQLYGPDAGTTNYYPTLKAYIDARDDDILEGLGAANTAITNLQNLTTKLQNALDDIIDRIFGATVNWNNNSPITWDSNVWGNASTGRKIPAADLNVWAGRTEGNASAYTNAIRSRSMSDNDITFN